MTEENSPATGSGWLDRRVDRKMRKRQLARMNDQEQLHFKIERRADRDKLNRQRLDKLATATRTVMIAGPILAPMAVAWTGQAGFAMKVIHWDFPAAVLYAAAYELTTAFCAWMYHEARKDGDSGFEYRFATWAFASGSATQQWWHYSDQWSATPRSVTFASMTMIGLMVWELYARLIHRRKLRDTKMRTGAMPRLGLVRWVRFPRLSWSTWSYMVRTGTRDMDQAWSAAELERTSRTKRGGWFRRTSPVREKVGGWSSTDQTVDQLPPLPDHLVQRVDQPGPLPEWADRRLVQPDQDGPDHAKLTGEWVGPADQTDPTPELTAGPDPVQTAPVDTAYPAVDFEPTDVERRAVQYMLDNDIRINRRNVGEVIRNHDGFKVAINTTRAGQVAKWGRDQEGPEGSLRAVS